MRKILSILLFLLFISLTLSLQAEEVNVTGDWVLTVESPRGEMKSDVNFVQEGEKLTVTMTNPRGGETKAEGTVKGNIIEWTVTRQTPRGEMTSTYTGKVEGNTMKGEVQFGDFGTFEWSAVRKEK